MTRSHECPLLLGLLALQNHLIDREALVAAFQRWLGDKSRPLGQVLVDLGALDARRLGALEVLADAHLRVHDGDVGRSLAAAAPSVGTVARLAALGDPELSTSVAALGPEPVDNQTDTVPGDADATTSYYPDTDHGRFHVLRPHARGGLGEVSVALDAELHREVALKEIQARFADDSASRARFLLEAEITGHLEHPGVVPVYGLGVNRAGRPFYAMRFVRGESLKDAITRLHGRPSPASPSPASGGREPPDASRDPGPSAPQSPDTPTMPTAPRAPGSGGSRPPGSLELSRLLRRFLDVCNAIAYAHSRGVIHRDLKPANILLGPYGETLVVDWGLAKIVGRAETPNLSGEPTLRPASGSGVEPTLPGAAVGTPAYMAPEQAAGRADVVGPRSDVYGLGAVLYAVLTGRAPFQGTTADVLAAVPRGTFPRPRAVLPEIPRALEAICLKAMAREPADRYDSPKALADDLEHWLADEPVAAYREPLPDRVRRWMRRHRTLASTTAASVLLGMLALGIVAMVLDGKRRALAAANADLDTQRRRAEDRERLAIDAVKRFGDVVANEPELKDNPALESLRKKLLKEPLAFFKTLRDQLQADRDTRPEALARLASAAFDLGTLTSEIGDTDDALRSYEEALTIYARLIRADPGPTAYLGNVALCHNQIGLLQRELGRVDQALGSFHHAREIQQRLVAEHPEFADFRRDLALSHLNIGLLRSETGHPDDARESYAEALKIQGRLTRAYPRIAEYRHDLAKTRHNLGLLESATGHSDRAMESYDAARDIQEVLVREDPGNDEYQGDLALIHHSIGLLRSATGHPDLALDSHRKALGIRQDLAREHPSNAGYRRRLALSFQTIGLLKLGMGSPAEALATLEESLEICKRLVSEHPGVTQFQSDLAAGHANIGLVQRETGRLGRALESFEKAVKIQERLVREHPTVTEFRRNLAANYSNTGALQIMTGHLDRALERFEKARDHFDRLARENPRVLDFQHTLAQIDSNIGALQGQMGHLDMASAAAIAGLEIEERLARENPGVPEFQCAVGGMLNNLAMIDMEKGHWSQALGKLRRASDHEHAALAVERRNPTYRQRLRETLSNLAEVECVLRHPVEAADTAREYAGLTTGDADDLYKIAYVFARCATLSEGPIADDRSRIADPELETYADEAMAYFKQAIAAGWNDWKHAVIDLKPLRTRRDFQELVFDRNFPAWPFAR